MPLVPRVAIVFALLCSPIGPGPLSAQRTRAGEPVLYQPIYPKRWIEAEVAREFVPWDGKEVSLLLPADHPLEPDPAVLRRFLKRLDAGWASLRELTGTVPRPYLTHDSKVSIALLPSHLAHLTCAEGCSYPGVTGIEIVGFFERDYDEMAEDSKVVRPYYFHHMAHNFFTYGDRHSLFEGGFSIFLRYVLLDQQKLKDPLAKTRRAIEDLEAVYAERGTDWFEAFTGSGNLYLDHGPSDPNALYASIMLYLRKRHGGDAFVERFLHALRQCPEADWRTPQGQRQQAASWAAAICIGARKDLGGLLVERWRLPLDQELLASLSRVRFTPRTTVAEVLPEPAEALR